MNNAPKWTDTDTAPPLSLIDAIATANRKLHQLRKEDESFKWTLKRIELTQEQESDWYYTVTFIGVWHRKTISDDGRVIVNPGRFKPKTMPEITIPVLLDGSIPEIKNHRYVDDLLKLLDQLDP